MKSTLKPTISTGNWLNKENAVHVLIEVRAYNAKELAVLYKITPKAMRKKLRSLAEKTGQRIGYYYTPRQVEIIFMQMGLPYQINETLQ